MRLRIRWTPGGVLTLLVVLVLAGFIGWLVGTWLPWYLGLIAALALLLLALLAAGVLYQQLADQRDRAQHLPPGNLVNVGEYRLHVQALGDPRESPTVVFENATGGASPEWGWIAPEVAHQTSVILYDRAGQGWSDETRQLADAYTTARDLHTVLENAAAHPPYILVGHALGGLLVRVFVQKYPGEVGGLLLIDPRPAELNQVFQRGYPEQRARAGWWLSLAARLGLLRLSGMAGQVTGCLPEEQGQEAASFIYASRAVRGWRRESRLAENASSMVALEPGSLGNLPLVVLSADRPDAVYGPKEREPCTEIQARMARLSRAGVHRVIAGADHYSIVLDTDHARVVTETIRQMVVTLREKT